MTPPATARTLAVSAALLCTGALAAACGTATQNGPGAGSPSSGRPATSATSTPPASPSSSSARSPAAHAAGSPCATSALKVTVDTSQAGGTAGSVYYPIDLTNTSGSSCTLQGYPGVSFVAKPSGSQIGQAATRNTTVKAAQVRLKPGGVAHATLRVVDAGNYDPSVCKPVTAHWLRVYPPGQRTAAYASFTAKACSAAVPAKLGAPLSVYVVRPGAGKAGQSP